MKKFLYYNIYIKEKKMERNQQQLSLLHYYIQKIQKNLYNYDESACVHLTGSHGNDK